MTQYGISVREILKRTVIVEAENIEETIQKVEDAVERDEIILDVDDYDDRELYHLNIGMVAKCLKEKMLVSIGILEKTNEGLNSGFYWRYMFMALIRVEAMFKIFHAKVVINRK